MILRHREYVPIYYTRIVYGRKKPKYIHIIDNNVISRDDSNPAAAIGRGTRNTEYTIKDNRKNSAFCVDAGRVFIPPRPTGRSSKNKRIFFHVKIITIDQVPARFTRLYEVRLNFSCRYAA